MTTGICPQIREALYLAVWTLSLQNLFTQQNWIKSSTLKHLSGYYGGVYFFH